MVARLVTGKDIKDESIKIKDLSKQAQPGLTGTPGPQGERGPQGETGPKGDPGPSMLKHTQNAEHRGWLPGGSAAASRLLDASGPASPGRRRPPTPPIGPIGRPGASWVEGGPRPRPRRAHRPTRRAPAVPIGRPGASWVEGGSHSHVGES